MLPLPRVRLWDTRMGCSGSRQLGLCWARNINRFELLKGPRFRSSQSNGYCATHSMCCMSFATAVLTRAAQDY